MPGKKASTRQIEQKILEEIFDSLSPSHVFQTMKSCEYDSEKTIRILCEETQEKVETKKQEFQTKLQIALPQKTSQHSSDEETHSKIRKATDVIKRIKWDPTFNIQDFVVGYLDRFEGIQEIPLSVFDKDRDVSSETFIPFHRIQYFKQKGELVWSRTEKIDKIFNPQQTQEQ